MRKKRIGGIQLTELYEEKVSKDEMFLKENSYKILEIQNHKMAKNLETDLKKSTLR